MPTRRHPRAPCQSDTPHELAIRRLIDSHQDLCRNGFWEAIKQLCDELGEDDVPTKLGFRFQPDAYRIDRQASEILLYEVEVTSLVTPDKMKLIAAFWEWWEASGDHDWMPRLFLVNRYGHQGEVDLSAHAYA